MSTPGPLPRLIQRFEGTVFYNRLAQPVFIDFSHLAGSRSKQRGTNQQPESLPLPVCGESG